MNREISRAVFYLQLSVLPAREHVVRVRRERPCSLYPTLTETYKCSCRGWDIRKGKYDTVGALWKKNRVI